MKTQVDTTQRKNKSKQLGKDYANRSHGYEMTINNKQKRL
jgi:hypothetical protein